MATSIPQEVKDLVEMVPAGRGSKALEGLDPETRALLDEFEAWLESNDSKSRATARAYKSYVAQALAAKARGEGWDKLTTDARSGVNAFVRFVEATAEA